MSDSVTDSPCTAAHSVLDHYHQPRTVLSQYAHLVPIPPDSCVYMCPLFPIVLVDYCSMSIGLVSTCDLLYRIACYRVSVHLLLRVSSCVFIGSLHLAICLGYSPVLYSLYIYIYTVEVASWHTPLPYTFKLSFHNSWYLTLLKIASLRSVRISTLF
jgi:hypothetical protein